MDRSYRQRYITILIIGFFSISIANNSMGQSFNVGAMAKDAMSHEAYSAAAYLLYADYLKNQSAFQDYECLAYYLSGINEFSLADSLLWKGCSNKNVDEYSDSLRFYYCASRARIDHYYNDNISALKNLSRIRLDSSLSVLKAECLDEIGLTNEAIKVYLSMLNELNGDYLNCKIGDCYRGNGQYDKAIEHYEQAKRANPTWAYPYYAIGWSYELTGEEELALKSYNEGLRQDQSYAYLFLMRGELYAKMGNFEEANRDFNEVLRRDRTIKDGTCRHFALFFLERYEDALNWVERLIEYQPYNSGHYYDKACLYCRMGLYENALMAMEVAFQKGYRRFAHLRADDDIAPIKNEPTYVAMFNKYYTIYLDEIEQLKGFLLE